MVSQNIPRFEAIDEIRPNIAFAGLTAAGKTTHAKLLAEELGYEYISATQIILDILNMQDDPEGIWFAKYDEIEKAREGDRVDIELEARVRALADKQSGLVLDTWAMAWIYDGQNPLVRLWIESDEPSRTRKCFVSQGKYPENNLQQCNDLINQKDSDTRDKFLKRLGFDLFSDRSRYDIVLDNSTLIPEATRVAADRGIAAFAPVVRSAVEYIAQTIADSSYDREGTQAESIIKASDGMIKRLGKVVMK